MPTFRLPILGFATNPDASGDVFFEPATIKATNDFFQGLVLVFNDSSNDDELFGRFAVPQNYVGSANVVIVWTTTATTGDVELGFAYRAVGGNDAESLDQATAQESLCQETMIRRLVPRMSGWSLLSRSQMGTSQLGILCSLFLAEKGRTLVIRWLLPYGSMSSSLNTTTSNHGSAFCCS